MSSSRRYSPIRRPKRSLLKPSEQEEREVVLQTGERLLCDWPSGDPRRLALEMVPTVEFKQLNGMRQVTTESIFTVASVAARQYAEFGGFDDIIEAALTRALTKFQRRLFDHLERESQPFVSKLSRRR